MSERESREFFYVGESGQVQKVVGYACKGTPGYWWCPGVGVSAAEGHSLFCDRADAYEKAYAVALDAFAVAKANLARIDRERWA